MKTHQYKTHISWSGNMGVGTLNYKAYKRDHIIHVACKAQNIMGSSDPSFAGDAKRFNPEELFLSSLSSCHMLWYLHLCSTNNIVVVNYTDQAVGIMEEEDNGSGHFTKVTLYPKVIVKDSQMIELANHLHEEANSKCFIANSCNFKIDHKPTTIVE